MNGASATQVMASYRMFQPGARCGSARLGRIEQREIFFIFSLMLAKC
jgi:hypothetical protein